MDRRNQPTAVWGQGIGYWCRLWQAQMEYSLRFWGAWAAQMPRPDAAQLAAEAEAMKAIAGGAKARGNPARPGLSRGRAVARGKPAAAPAKRPASRPALVPAPQH